ncbi:MAG TPA: class I adenylate-forming enzyme family protein [Egibacteraceae bacterium]|nr:class I adenylate-forming enzyme family protein [Egibacteraceae bacterium]
MSGGNLAPSMQVACERWPARPALTYRGGTLTYAQLWERVLSLAWAYRSLGVGPGDRVVCQLPTCPEHLIAAAAAWACGAIHVGAHRDLTPHELTALVGRTQASAVVAQPPPALEDPRTHLQTVRAAHPSTVLIGHGLAPVVEDGLAPVVEDGLAPGLSGVHLLSELLAAPSPHPTPPAAVGPEDTALLVRTSGTTGEPKLVLETLPALWAKMEFFAEAVRPGPDDVHLAYLPISHVFGLKLALMALASGGRVVCLDPFSPEAALRLVAAEGVTVLPGSPTHLTLLLQHLDAARYPVESLRWVVSAAAPLPPGLVPQVYERLGVEMLYVYGCSEGFLTRTTDPDEIRRGSVGRTVFRGSAVSPSVPPDGSVAVFDVDGSTPLPAGEVGEIVFGATRPVRYWREPPVATDGWYRSGDLGWLDNDGLLFVSGRLKEVINRGGLKVASGEIEVALGEHPGVSDCAVVPAPDPVLGEAICACVVPASPAPPTLSVLREHLHGRLARHKLPDELCLLEAIPRSAVGKIDRTAVVARVIEGGLPRERLRPLPQGPVPSTRRP